MVPRHGRGLKRPILGYGYEAFWQGFKGDSRGILEATGWLVPMAHNGYLDLRLSLGLIGIAAYLFVFLRSMRMALNYLRYDRRTIAVWPVAYLCFFSLHNTAKDALNSNNFRIPHFCRSCSVPAAARNSPTVCRNTSERSKMLLRACRYLGLLAPTFGSSGGPT